MEYDNRFSLFSRGRTHLTFDLGGVRIAYAYIRKNACSTFKRAVGMPDTRIEGVEAAFPFDRRHDVAIFVYRDPVERLVSLYKSKILEQRNAIDIQRIYRETMGEEPSGFDRFVDFCILGIDPHSWTQASHLRRLKYLAIPMHELHTEMVRLVGETAAAPFATKSNATREDTIDVSDETRTRIERHYAADCRLINQIGRSA